MNPMEFGEIIKMIAESAGKKKTIQIYYSKTENSPPGWREVEPYSFATDTGGDGEHLVYGKETVTSGHILNAYTVGSNKKYCNSFILGKIKKVKAGNYIFKPRWKIEI